MLKSPDCVIILILVFTSMLGYGQQYSATHKSDVIDHYHGYEIRDPYRWMEDTQSPSTQGWMQSQDQLLKTFVVDFPLRKKIRANIERLANTGSSYNVPTEANGYLYFNKFDPALKNGVLYRQKGEDGVPNVLFDPNQALEETQSYGGYSVSPDGKYVAILISQNQNRWGDLRLFSVSDRKFSEVSIGGIAGISLVWKGDGSGFYYITYGETKALNDKVMDPIPVIKFHQLGTSPREDRLIYSRPDLPNAIFTTAVTQDYSYFIVRLFNGRSDQNDIFLINLENGEVASLIEGKNNRYAFIGNHQEDYFFLYR